MRNEREMLLLLFVLKIFSILKSRTNTPNRETDKQQRHYLDGLAAVVDVTLVLHLYINKYNEQTFSLEIFGIVCSVRYQYAIFVFVFYILDFRFGCLVCLCSLLHFASWILISKFILHCKFELVCTRSYCCLRATDKLLCSCS